MYRLDSIRLEICCVVVYYGVLWCFFCFSTMTYCISIMIQRSRFLLISVSFPWPLYLNCFTTDFLTYTLSNSHSHSHIYKYAITTSWYSVYHQFHLLTNLLTNLLTSFFPSLLPYFLLSLLIFVPFSPFLVLYLYWLSPFSPHDSSRIFSSYFILPRDFQGWSTEKWDRN